MPVGTFLNCQPNFFLKMRTERHVVEDREAAAQLREAAQRPVEYIKKQLAFWPLEVLKFLVQNTAFSCAGSALA